MKRILSILICAVTIFVMATAVSAEEGFKVVISSDADAAGVGEEVTLTVSLSGAGTSRSGSIDVSLGDSLELISGEMLQSGAFMKDFNLEKMKGVAAFSSLTSFDGDFAKLTVRVKEGTSRKVSVTVKLLPSEETRSCVYTVKDPDVTYPSAAVDMASARTGATVTLGVTLKNAPPIKALSVSDISFDADSLELIGGEWELPDAVLADWKADIGKGVAAFKNETDLNGKIFTLTLKVKDGANEADYPVSLKVTAKDLNGDDVEIDKIPGSVRVIKGIYGDVNGDGVVNLKDATLIRRYYVGGWGVELDMTIADVNGDGVVNLKDATLIRRYYVGGWGVEFR
ncbi:MAG: hypothetical protein IKN38_09140 [Clostridia bacterium]|nr:hypothetical protein [Clostridia bacterium]